MKNQFKKMMENPKFKKSFEEIKQTANYFVATYDGDNETDEAIALCMAYAFEAGLRAGEGDKQ